MKKVLLSLLVVVFSFLEIPKVSSFEVTTHRALSRRAVDSSKLDDFLKTQLGRPEGIATNFSDRGLTLTVREWIEEGSDREDEDFRFFNHFHNPLRTWDQAGLRILGAQLGNSSVLWGQRESQGAAWQNARTSYFEALTATTEDERDAKLASTFQMIGQLIHLPQDAAVPAHTRNDQHTFFEGFERFALNITGTSLFDQLTVDPTTGKPKEFDPSILNLPQNPLAPVPIARIIDTTDPEQAEAVPGAGTDQGLAEYSNANFLSGDTIFKNFTFPRIESLGQSFPEAGRLYFPKVSEGEPVPHFVAEGTFTERLLSLASGDKGFVLDPHVYQDYASLLLPRAVGYSAGLLDYFFRGRIELKNVATPGYSLGSPVTSLQVNGRNVTPDEEAGDGEVVAVATFTMGGQESFAASSPKMVSLTRDFQEIVFDFTQSPIPAGAKNSFLFLVYRGPLGLEDGAVVVGGKCWNPIPATFDFPSPGVFFTEAFGINSCGQIVGSWTAIEGGNDRNRGFLLSDGVFTAIEVPGDRYTDARGINDAGQIVGTFTPDSIGRSRGYLLSEGTFTTIGVPDALSTFAEEINNAGQIVGWFQRPGGPLFSGFLLSGGNFTIIDRPGANETTLADINDAGQIVGGSDIGAFLRSPDGGFTSIPGGVNGINNLGEIVGTFKDTNGNLHGYVLSEGVLTTIDVPDARETTVQGINDDGQIVGTFEDINFDLHGFFLNSVTNNSQ